MPSRKHESISTSWLVVGERYSRKEIAARGGVKLVLLSLGCLLRVSGEVLGYQALLDAAWTWLPYSALLELAGVTLFAINLITTFLSDPLAQSVATNARGSE